MRTQRRLLLALGGALGLLLVVGMALAMPAAHKRHHHKPTCLPYSLIPSVHICGSRVYLVAAGRKQYIGLTKDLQPMPAPLPFHRHMKVGK